MMNKMVRAAAGAVVMMTSSIMLNAHTNKTYLSTRPHGVNMALTNPGGCVQWEHKPREEQAGAFFKAIGFYQGSTNKSQLGRYFGTKSKQEISLGTNLANGPVTAQDLNAREIIHQDQNPGAGPIFAAGRDVAQLKLDPDQSSYGVVLCYVQDLYNVRPGCYFSVTMPVVHVRNDIDLAVSGANKVQFEQYFRGDYAVPIRNRNAQGRLTHAKIAGSTNATGIADVNVVFGHRFCEKNFYNLSLSLGLTIPTGNEPTGQELFEAIYGNGHHTELGLGVDGDVRVWQDNKQEVKLRLALDYRYLFKAKKIRTLGIKERAFGRYVLLGVQNHLKSVVQLQPAANVLTQTVMVSPKSRFEGVLEGMYETHNIRAVVGYNVYLRERESVKVRQKLRDRLLIVNPNVNMSVNVLLMANEGTALTQEMVDTSVAQTPAQNTHKLYAHVSYTCDRWQQPVNVGLGAHYEFAGNNASLATWGINGSLGVSF